MVAGVALVAGVEEGPVDGNRPVGAHLDEARPTPEVAVTDLPWFPRDIPDLDPLSRREQQVLRDPAVALGKCGCKDPLQPFGWHSERFHERPVAPGKIAAPGEIGVERRVQFFIPGRVVIRRRNPEERLRLSAEGKTHPREDAGAGLERPDHAPEVGVACAFGALQPVGVDPVQGGEEVAGVPGDTVRRDRDRECLLTHRRRTEVSVHKGRVVYPEPEHAFNIESCDSIHIPGLGGVLAGVG